MNNIKPSSSLAHLLMPTLFRPTRRSPVDSDSDSSVTLLKVRQISEHEAFALSRHASPATIRRSCWPIGTDAAGAAELQAFRVAGARDAASPEALKTNRARLDRICDHYRQVTAGKVRFADAGFTSEVMRPFVTWLRALRDLDRETHQSCGRCADDLMSIVMSTKREVHVDGTITEKHVSLSQLGATDGLAVNIDGQAMARYFLHEIEQILDDFFYVVKSGGSGSDMLSERIGELRSAPIESSREI
jgi:hypothetical protein